MIGDVGMNLSICLCSLYTLLSSKKEDWMANVWDNLGECAGAGFGILISLCT